MRQNFKRDKSRKEEARRKKQEEKRNKRLHKKEDPSGEISNAPFETTPQDTQAS